MLPPSMIALQLFLQLLLAALIGPPIVRLGARALAGASISWPHATGYSVAFGLMAIVITFLGSIGGAFGLLGLLIALFLTLALSYLAAMTMWGKAIPLPTGKPIGIPRGAALAGIFFVPWIPVNVVLLLVLLYFA